MAIERENNNKSLGMTDFEIGGDVFRVYYKPDGEFVFVIDGLINDTKPNVLLVINPDGNRKWDDILENDYGIDLETVRPKKDNKYQKLDIEYSGLNLYSDLVQAYLDEKDISSAAQALHVFRNESIKRATQERLDEAQQTVERAGDTIDKTNEKIHQLQQSMRELKNKLVAARREIGKEPTKQSASKILRLESLIDMNEEKLKRAKKRLVNAERRLGNANDDAVAAQNLLAKLSANLPTQPLNTNLTMVADVPVPAVVDDDDFETDLENKTKADDMADEDVKPLFDTDPDILDEEIAFKPIEFNTDAVQNVPAVAPENNLVISDDIEPAPVADNTFTPSYEENSVEDEFVPAPLTFTPPVSSFDTADTSDEDTIKPMFDGFTPFPEMEEQETETTTWTPTPIVSEERPVQDVLEPVVADSMPEVAPAPVSSDFRPVSPIQHENTADRPVVTPVSNVTDGGSAQAKPTLLYYVLLIVLIVLSIFTLWFYQQASNENMPELATVTETGSQVAIEEPVMPTDVVPEPVPVTESVVVAEPEPAPVIEPVVVAEPEPEPVIEPVVVAEPEPVVVEVEPEPVPVTEPVVENPFVDLPADAIVGPIPVIVDEEPVAIPTEEEVLATKPAYGVSQQEKMFVADKNYETETVVESVEPTIVRVPQYTEQVVTEESVDVCSDGNAPDSYGCCAGEEFVLLPDGERACCAESTGECFPPM